MNFRKRTMILATLALGLALGSAANGRPQAHEADSTAIKTVIETFTDAFNNHNAQALAACMTEEADFTNSQQTTSHGRKDIADHMQEVFVGRLKNAHRTYTINGIRFLTADTAAVSMNYDLTGTLGPNDTELPLRKGLYLWVMTRHNGKWLIDVIEESELPKPSPPVAK